MLFPRPILRGDDADGLDGRPDHLIDPDLLDDHLARDGGTDDREDLRRPELPEG